MIVLVGVSLFLVVCFSAVATVRGNIPREERAINRAERARHAQAVRILDRWIADDMIAVSIPPAEKREAAKITAAFYDSKQIDRKYR